MTLLPPNISSLMVPVPAPVQSSDTPVPRTMLLPSQLQEAVPLSTAEWLEQLRDRQRDAWDDAEPATDTLVPSYAMIDHVGWSGTELRRRMAFVYLTVLRAQRLL